MNIILTEMGREGFRFKSFEGCSAVFGSEPRERESLVFVCVLGCQDCENKNPNEIHVRMERKWAETPLGLSHGLESNHMDRVGLCNRVGVVRLGRL